MAHTHIPLQRKTATSVFSADNGAVSVRYHNTVVARLNGDGTVTLNTGGWQTVTTKRRMNQALAMWGSDLQVFQRDFSWYLSRYYGDGKHGEPMEFVAGKAYALRDTGTVQS